jgi:hypothetical protein
VDQTSKPPPLFYLLLRVTVAFAIIPPVLGYTTIELYGTGVAVLIWVFQLSMSSAEAKTDRGFGSCSTAT